jgi:hypothetical protein
MGRVADNGAGIIDQRHGATGSADMMRIMDPTHGTSGGTPGITTTADSPWICLENLGREPRLIFP